MFELKKIAIDTKHELIAILTEADAKDLSLQSGDRIKIRSRKAKKDIIAELQVLAPGKHPNFKLKDGQIALLEDAFTKLESWEKSRVDVMPAPKPKSVEYVRAKFLGDTLNEEQFKEIMQDIVNNAYSEVETTYFVLACTVHQLEDMEVVGLINAMVSVGKQLNFKEHKNDIVVDKHCIGGVPNNRTSMLVIPIVAAAGLIIPKTSSRSITSPAGTADTMEVLANVSLPLSDMYHTVKDVGACLVWGGGLDLSPADDIIIQVEHPLGIDSEGQMIASILSKKKSAGSSHVLIDIPVGPTAKVRDMDKGKRLKKRFEWIGKKIGLHCEVIITDGSQPIGRGIGPYHEALDVMRVLENDPLAPQDLREKTLFMAGKLLELASKAKPRKGYEMAKFLLDSGKALDKFNEIRDAQGRVDYNTFAPKHSEDIYSHETGVITSIHNKKLSKTAFILGAPGDKGAGMRLKKKVGDKIQKGEPIMTIYSNSKLKMQYAKNYMEDNFPIIATKK